MPSGMEVLVVAEVISLGPGLQEPPSSEAKLSMDWFFFLGVPQFCCSSPPPDKANTTLPNLGWHTAPTAFLYSGHCHHCRHGPSPKSQTRDYFMQFAKCSETFGIVYLPTAWENCIWNTLPLLVRESLSSLVVNQAWLTADTSSLPIGEISSNCSFWRILKRPVWNDTVRYWVVYITLQLTWRHSLKENEISTPHHFADCSKVSCLRYGTGTITFLKTPDLAY